MVETAIEHRLMHLRDIGILLHRLAPEKKVSRAAETAADLPAKKPAID